MAQAKCVQAATMDTAQMVTNNEGFLLPPVDILDYICPEDCNGRGDCAKGLLELYIFV